MTDIYQDKGYLNRKHYLECLAEEYSLDLEQVIIPLADMLGAEEDFEGLLIALGEDWEQVDREQV